MECFVRPDWMKQVPLFVGAFDDIATIPTSKMSEIAVIGRSNVGKSSLLNAITGYSKLARVSNTPGRTQTLNFFNWSDRLMLVDLPGYGYAKASKAEIFKWEERMKIYLFGRPNLRRVFLLIDSRHGIKDSDVEIMKQCDASGVNYQVVLTKIDKVSEKELVKILGEIENAVKKHGACHPDVLATSSEKKCGLDPVLMSICEVC